MEKNNIFYKVSGFGPPLILLHGWGSTSDTFDNLVEQLNEDYTCYQLDLPGFGKSYLQKAYSLDDYVEVLKSFCTELEIENPSILGHSFGGRIAIKYASLYDVCKLILVSTPGIKEKPKLKNVIRIRIYKILKYFNIKVIMGSKDYRNAKGVLKETLVKIVNEDLNACLQKINIPTLVIFGEKDNIVPVRIAKKMHALIPSSGLVIIPKCGHFPYIERYRYFLIVLKSFLTSDTI